MGCRFVFSCSTAARLDAEANQKAGQLGLKSQFRLSCVFLLKSWEEKLKHAVGGRVFLGCSCFTIEMKL